MKPIFKKEVWLWLIMAVPIAYLLMIWKQLPDTVPIHWNYSGEADGWGPKAMLWLLLFLLLGFPYALMLIVPYVDPKGKISQMGNKFFQLRVILVIMLSALATVIIYMTKLNGQPASVNWTFAVCGVLFAGLGNFFQTIRPNYFMGIRTPWALESERVWRKTHRMAGRLWIAGGILIVLVAVLLPSNALQFTLFIVLLAILCLIPAAYSFITWRQEQKIKS
ncbi:SdpI family protein [Nostoc ellipsosporum NOK]|nr:SdpI family protein [Nostoc ellipsosporum NOK]